jgi:hypothetical protein
MVVCPECGNEWLCAPETEEVNAGMGAAVVAKAVIVAN